MNGFIAGFTDLRWKWVNWTDLINNKCGGEEFTFPNYEEDLEFNRQYFFNCICNKGLIYDE